MNRSKKAYSKEVLEKIESFRKAGVLVIDRPYEGHDFSSFGLPRDVEVTKDIAYTHRYDNGQDIYFLANQSEKKRSFYFSMRQKASTLFLFDPLNGRYDAVFCDQKDGRDGTDITTLRFADCHPFGKLQREHRTATPRTGNTMLQDITLRLPGASISITMTLECPLISCSTGRHHREKKSNTTLAVPPTRQVLT